MALINCPECGREKVSDSAEMCPDCGYNIKKHFENKQIQQRHINQKTQEERIQQKIKKHKEKEEREKRKNPQKKLEEEQARKEQLIKKLTEEKNQELKVKIGTTIWSLIWTIIWIWSFSTNEEGSLGLIIVISFFCAFAGWGLLVLTAGSSAQLEMDIEIASKNIDEYQKLVNDRLEYSKIQSEKNAEENRRKNAIKHPKCPMCGSTNTERISTTSRAVSVAAVGLASGKIGKQYRCKNCKHMW